MLKKPFLVIAFVALTIALSGCIQQRNYASLNLHFSSQPITLPKDYILFEEFDPPAMSLLKYQPNGIWKQYLDIFSIEEKLDIRIIQVPPPTRCFFKDIKIGMEDEYARVFWPLESSDPPIPPLPDEAWYAAHSGSIHGIFEVTMEYTQLFKSIGEVKIMGTFSGRIVNGKDISLHLLGNFVGVSGSIDVDINATITMIDPITGETTVQVSGRGLLVVAIS